MGQLIEAIFTRDDKSSATERSAENMRWDVLRPLYCELRELAKEVKGYDKAIGWNLPMEQFKKVMHIPNSFDRARVVQEMSDDRKILYWAQLILTHEQRVAALVAEIRKAMKEPHDHDTVNYDYPF